jgi:DNA-binding IscR family transcriptional regulator
VTSTEGAGGGTVLARPPGRITLADVFKAVEQEELFSMPRKDPNPLCPVGRSVQGVVGEHSARFEKAVQREMKRVSIADILADVRATK